MGSGKKAVKPKIKKPRTRTIPKDKVDKFVENIAQGKKRPDAVIDAGWNQTRKAARVTASRLLSNANILERVERRKEEAMRRAQIHTDIIVGSLAEIATASLADVLDDNGEFDLQAARDKGTDHLIKKLRVKTRYYSNGAGKNPDKEVTHEYEMYSRLDALNQLRDNFGMKQEPRQNNYEEIKRQEVERSIQRIMERDGVEKRVAAQTLLTELGDAPEIAPIVSSYVN